MNRSEMLTELREVIDDSALRSAWSKATLLRYLAEGQDKFCEQTGYFTDISSYSIELATGIAVYDIPDRIIQIVEIWNGGTKLEHIRTGEAYSYSETVATGMPTHWDTNQETGIITLYPTPLADHAGAKLALQVWRYSKYALDGLGAVPETGVTPPASPEIPGRFQRACIEWAAYKAFMHHDMESQDPVKAADHLEAFKGYVADGRAALRRFQNQEAFITSNPTYRT